MSHSHPESCPLLELLLRFHPVSVLCLAVVLKVTPLRVCKDSTQAHFVQSAVKVLPSTTEAQLGRLVLKQELKLLVIEALILHLFHCPFETEMILECMKFVTVVVEGIVLTALHFESICQWKLDFGHNTK